MLIRELLVTEKAEYASVVHHIMQSWEWGETKELLGKETHRYGLFNDLATLYAGYQLSIHPLPAPLSTWKIGYLPKCTLPNSQIIHALLEFGRAKSIIFFKIEPDIYANLANPNEVNSLQDIRSNFLKSSNQLFEGKELFTKYDFHLDLTLPEETLLQNMHPKTRYNINLAQKKGVQVKLHTDDDAFKIFLDIYFETTRRQGYFGHDQRYHSAVWNTLRRYDMARILIAYYDKEPLTAWMLFNYCDTIYYPYGGSRLIHRELMASNLVAWETIKLGKQMNMKKLDLWGAMGPDPDTTDPFYGFHRFKAGYNPTHVEYLGSYDLVLNPQYYKFFLKLQQWRTKALQIKASLKKSLPFIK